MVVTQTQGGPGRVGLEWGRTRAASRRDRSGGYASGGDFVSHVASWSSRCVTVGRLTLVSRMYLSIVYRVLSFEGTGLFANNDTLGDLKSVEIH